MNSKFDWLIVIFVHEINNNVSEDCYNQFISNWGFLNVDFKRNKIVLIFDDFICDDIESNEVVFSKTVKVSDDSGVLYKDDRLMEGVNLKNKNSWKNILKRTFNIFSTERIFFFTYSHGNGVGINVEQTRIGYDQSLNKLIEIKDFVVYKNPFKIIPQKRFKNLEESREGSNISGIKILPIGSDNKFIKFDFKKNRDCKNIDAIWIEDLKDGFKMALNENQKVDIMVMLNCCMMTLDTCVFLKDSVHKLIGFETMADAWGFNLVDLINKLNSNDLEWNCSMIMSNYFDNVSKYGKEYTDVTVIGTVDLSLFNNMELRKISKLFKLLIKNLNLIKGIFENNFDLTIIPIAATINILKEQGMGTETVDLFDFHYLLDIIAKNCNEEKELIKSISLCQKFLNKVNKPIIIGERIISNDKENELKYAPNGISIFIPYHMQFVSTGVTLCAIHNEMSNSYRGSLFFWDNFIRQIIPLQMRH